MLTKKILDAVFKKVDGQKFEIEYWDGETNIFNSELKSKLLLNLSFRKN